MLKQRVPAAISGGMVAALLSSCGTTGDATKGTGAPPEPSALLYVAPNGNDAWSGRFATPNAAQTDGPVATLERARDELRKLKQSGGLPTGPCAVELSGGRYELKVPFELTAEDSGTESGAIVYRAKQGEEVRLVGGKLLSNWQPVTDPATLERLDPSARGKVLQADLKALGLTDLGEVTSAGKLLEFFFRDQPMPIARWPNEGFVKIVDVLGQTPIDVRGTKGTKEGIFTYADDRPTRWKQENDLWLHGYWFWDWSDQRQKVASIDTEKRVITLAPPVHAYGYREGQWFYAFNALAELDTPGEWYLDRSAGILYFWPPASLKQGAAVVSVLPTLVTLKDTAHITLRGLIFEAARDNGIVISGGTHNEVVGCTLRNLGAWAVRVGGGTANGVIGCDIYATGDGGITLDGGDRKTLTPAGNFADNNHIHHYSRWNRICRPGIALGGVGNRATHNLIDNAPHQAISFGGNDHLIEFNEIHSVCYESNDAGAIYSGRDWTMRGTVIRYNYLHHINGFEGRGCVGVYLDDMFCGTEIVGNLFYKVTRAAFVGGGRDCTIANNIFVDCPPAVHIDARAMGWAGYHADDWVKEGTTKGTLSGIRYNEPPYSTRYPKLINILAEEPHAPRGNLVARNVCSGGTWDEIEAKARPLVTLEDNLVEAEPGFVNASRENFQLRDDSPAYKLGFQRIPLEQIGLYQDGRRASWPVKHTVRDMTPVAVLPKSGAVRTGPPPVFTLRRTTAPIQIDGVIEPQEWAGADPAKAMVVEQDLQGEKVKPASLAWFAYDDQGLVVAIDNAVNPATALKPGNEWGRDDAVELAFRNPAAGKDAPILVLRGYPSGHFESSPEAGASAAAVKQAAEGVLYAAKVVAAGRWTAEWRIPFAALGIDPAKPPKLAFNLSVRKTAGPDWVLWQGTRAATWAVGNAGMLELAR
jgi:hypothetical protein